ncbi:putative ribosomal protein S11 [Besnoitia besnoiti]|uniref:Putative ribosomal protein S11 n=1 Tax=Besnoitia besnoiti TaxID=94643 RepID=A0A2A9MQQ3_BESBE|nr:putative ribosomal protein S11 [Besnoitia besnoiti]PFH38673.1 putative ribosomal protein S11 [Besnoitia besnoiti]
MALPVAAFHSGLESCVPLMTAAPTPGCLRQAVVSIRGTCARTSAYPVTFSWASADAQHLLYAGFTASQHGLPMRRTFSRLRMHRESSSSRRKTTVPQRSDNPTDGTCMPYLLGIGAHYSRFPVRELSLHSGGLKGKAYTSGTAPEMLLGFTPAIPKPVYAYYRFRQRLFFSTTKPASASDANLSPGSQAALSEIRSNVERAAEKGKALAATSSSSGGAGRQVKKQLSKKEMRTLGGHPRRFKLMGGRPEFHHVDRNKNGHIIEPTDKFQVVITTSKNNVHAQVVNKSRAYRTIFGSFAGNVGIRKQAQQGSQCAYRIGQNIARKCRRLGISQVEIKFRRIMRVNQLLQAFTAHGLGVTAIAHEPRLPKCGQNATKPRKRRRV